MPIRSLGQEDPLEKEMATCSSVLAWKIPWTEESEGLQSVRLKRVGHDWGTEHVHIMTCIHHCRFIQSDFTALKSSVLCLFSSPLPQSLETNGLLTISLCAKSLQFCLTLYDLKGHSPPGSSVHGIFQARTLEWVAVPSCRGSSPPRDLLIATIYGSYPISLLYITWFSANQSRLPEILLKMQVIMSHYSLKSPTGYSGF